MILKKVAFFLLITTSFSFFGQNYILPNEVSIFTFETQNGKTVMLAKDKKNEYIIYRFGTKDKIEFEYPDKTKSSWSKFKYSYWLRGGGKINEGIDLEYIAFINDNYKYVIYDTYFAVEEKYSVGVKIINLKTNKITDIKGKIKSKKGRLNDFRNNELIEEDDELYD